MPPPLCLFLLAVLFAADSPHNVLRDVQGELPHAGPAKLLHDPGAADAVVLGGIGDYRRGVERPISSPLGTHPPREQEHDQEGGGVLAFAVAVPSTVKTQGVAFFRGADDIGTQFSQAKR
jgi:hypothetical protein